MRHKTDFPALSEAIVRIQRMATSDTESVNSITNEILKDIALTNKLLRLVNSAHYARSGNISTVSRAVTLVGFNGIRNMALSLVLLEHMNDREQARNLKDEFLRCLLAGSIASELCPVAAQGEEAFIAAMFHNLGRLLARYYFPDEADAVLRLVNDRQRPLGEAAAAVQVLGLSLEDLGSGVAKAWGLPPAICNCMHKSVADPPAHGGLDSSERLRWTALMANEMSEALLLDAPCQLDRSLVQIGKRYANAVGCGVGQIQSATTLACRKLVEMAAAMEITARPGSAAARLLEESAQTLSAAPAATDTEPDLLLSLELQASPQATPAAIGAAPDVAQQAAQTLSAGIQDITNALVEDFNLSDVLRMILETMYRAKNFQRIIFCLRDAKTDVLSGRFGLGQDIETMVKLFNVSLRGNPPDMFSLICSRGVDTLIRDASDGKIASHLPPWYRQSIAAATFLLLPVTVKTRPLGLIYADQAQPGALLLDDRELALLRTLRNQAVMAFKQSV